MKIINIKVTDKLKVTGIVNGDNTSNSNIPVKIASGNYKSIILNFEFDNTIWDDNLEKYATFSVENQEGIQVKLEKIDKYQNACYVPFSVLKQNCKINVGAYGTITKDDNVEKIISTENLYFLVVDGSFSQYLVDETPVDIEKIKLLKDEIISEIDNYSKEKQGNYDENAKTKLSAYNKNCEEKLKNYNDNTIAKIEEYNSNADQKIDEYNENADDLIKLTTSTSNELYRLKTDVLETGESSGNNIHLEDSALSEMQEISVDGVCKQETTTGNNLFNIIDYSKLTLQDNGYPTNIVKLKDKITFKSNLSSGYSGVFMPKITYQNYIDEFEENVPYYISANIKTNVACTFRFVNEKIETPIQVGTTRMKFNGVLPQNIAFYVKSTNTNIEISNLMISKVDIDYEPYTGNQPSPSPDFPQEIKTLTGDIKLTSAGRNLLDYVSNLITSNNGLTSVINDDGSITTSGKPTSNYSTITKTIDITDILEDKSTYTISQTVPANLFVQINIRKLNGTLKYVNSNKGSSSFIVDKSIYSSYTLVIQTTSMETWGDSPLTITNKYMLCKGTDTADTSFEPYQGSSLNITIPSNEFAGKINDTYKDTLNVVYKDDGHYHLILNKMIGKIVLDGVTNCVTSINLRNGNHTVCNYVNNDIKALESENIIIANKLIGTTISKTWNGNIIYSIAQSTNGHYLQLCLPSTFTTSEQINNWLKDNPTIVYYFLETPYEVDLGIVDTLLSYDEITNIFTNSDLYPVINVKYYRNFIKTIQNLQVNNDTLKNELSNIESRLAALESANTSVVDNNPSDTEESEVTE